MESIDRASSSPYVSVNTHIKKALSLYSDRKNPDYENSIKESISAVEAMCCIITGMTGASATLGAALKKLEDIVFPRLKEDFSRWAAEQGKDVVAFESATVLEKEQFDDFGDVVLLVDAPMDVRLSRACSRDGADKAKVQERMAAQPLMNSISDGGACERVDCVILNDGSIEELEQKLTEFVEKYGLTKML